MNDNEQAYALAEARGLLEAKCEKVRWSLEWKTQRKREKQGGAERVSAVQAARRREWLDLRKWPASFLLVVMTARKRG